MGFVFGRIRKKTKQVQLYTVRRKNLSYRFSTKEKKNNRRNSLEYY